jgi:hypothetical protein
LGGRHAHAASDPLAAMRPSVTAALRAPAFGKLSCGFRPDSWRVKREVEELRLVSQG